MSARFSVWFSRVSALAKRVERRLQRLDAAGIERPERGRAAHDLKRRALLRTGLGEEERAVLELERREDDLRAEADLLAWPAPAQPAGDHQVDDEDERVLVVSRPERDRNALPNARDVVNGRADEAFDRRIDRAEHERTQQPDSLESAAADVRRERFYVHCHVGQFRHPPSVAQDADAAGRRPGPCV